MENNQFLTKKKWMELFRDFGIRSGSVVCLQGNISRFGTTLDGYQAVIDALLELVGDNGCVMVPTFTYSCLDPSCRNNQMYPFEMWKDIREQMKGYSAKLTPSSIYKDLCDQFLRYKGVVRTTHPVYSFAFLGKIDESWIKQPLNYPVSFVHVLKGFVSKNAYNVLLGIPKEESILIPAISKTMNKGITEVQRAYIHKQDSNQLKTYLNLKVDIEYVDEVMEMLDCQSKKVNGEFIHCITIEN